MINQFKAFDIFFILIGGLMITMALDLWLGLPRIVSIIPFGLAGALATYLAIKENNRSFKV